MHTTAKPSATPESPLRSVSAALLCTVIVLVYAVTDATLLFGAPFPERVPTGLGMALVGAAVAAAVIASGSALPGAIAGAQELTVIMLAAMVVDIEASFPDGADRDAAFATALAAIALATLSIGVTCRLAASFRLGRFVHFVPWPVIAGLLAGSGVALMLASVPILVGRGSIADLVGDFAPRRDGVSLASGLAVVAGLFVAARRRAAHLAMAGTLALAGALWYAGALLGGHDLAALRNAGLTLASAPTAIVYPPLRPNDLGGIDWVVLAAQAPVLAAISLMTLCAVMIKIGAVGLVLDRDLDEDRELRAVGRANLIGGCAFAVPGFHTVALTQIVHRLGATRALTAFVLAAFVLVSIPFAGAALASVPRFLVGGVLLWVGADLLATWLLAAHASLARLELGIVLAIAVTIAVGGFVLGLAVGFGCTFVLFVLEYGRTEVLRGAPRSRDARSNVDRDASELEALERASGSLLVLRLQGYLFFGSGHRLLERLREHVSALEPAHVARLEVIVDLERVSGLDVSAVHALERVCAFARRRGFALSFAAVPPSRRAALGRAIERQRRDSWRAPEVLDTLDAALQRREERLLAEGAGGTAAVRGAPITLEPEDAAASDADALVAGLGAANVDRLGRHAETLELLPGEELMTRGVRPDALYVVRTGRLAVHLDDTAPPSRARSVGPGALLGEVSLLLGGTASADVVAETPCRVWRITAAALEHLLEADPALASRFNRHVATVLAARLRDNARQLRLLSS